MITVPKAELKKLDELIEQLEEMGIRAEDAAARLNIALGDILAVAADRSRIAHDAHKLLRKLQQGEQ